MRRTTSKESLFSIASDAPCSEVFNIGDKCKLGGDERIGVVAFVGRTQFAPGDWVGLVLETADGKNDGSVSGVSYFECEDKHGLFCRPSKLVKLAPAYASPHSPSLSIANSTATNAKAPRSRFAGEYGYDIGERVVIPGGKMGVVKFLDTIDGAVKAGVLLDRPLGTCDGSLNGRRYFKCNPLYGVFTEADKVKKVALAQPSKMAVRHNKASTLRQSQQQGTSASVAAGGWRGSQESLNSLGLSSTCSSSKFNRASPRIPGARLPSITTPTGIPHTIREGGGDEVVIASLRNCLQEKEAHLERLSKELNDQQRTEMERIDHLDKANTQLQQKVRQLEELLDESEKAKISIESELDRHRHRVEELSFLFEEAEVLRVDAENVAKQVREEHKQAEAIPLVDRAETSCQTEGEAEKHKPRATTAEAHVQVEQPRVDTSANFTQTEQLTAAAKLVETACGTDRAFTGVDAQVQVEKAHVVEVHAQTTAQTKSSGIETGVQTEIISTPCAEAIQQTDAAQLSDQSEQTTPGEVQSTGVQTIPEPTPPKPSITHSTSQTNVVERAEQGVLVALKPSSIDAVTETTTVGMRERDMQTEGLKELEKKLLAHMQSQTDPPFKGAHAGVQVELTRPSLENSTQTERAGSSKHVAVQIELKKSALENATQTTPNKTEERGVQLEQETPPPRPALANKGNQTELEAVKANPTDSATQTSVKGVATTHTQTMVDNKSVQNVNHEGRANSCASVTTQTDSPPMTPGNEPQLAKPPVGGNPPVVELDVSKLGHLEAGMPSQLAWEEKYRTQNERMEKLDSTVSFLNSIISEQTNTIKRLRTELNENHLIKESMDRDAVVSKRNTEAKRLREYCDYCEVFDEHDTSKCPARLAEEKERKSHKTVISPPHISDDPPPRGKRRQGEAAIYAQRLFCDLCDAFSAHDTGQCPKLATSLSEAKN